MAPTEDVVASQEPKKRYIRFMLFEFLTKDNEEEEKEVVLKYPYPRFRLFSAGLHYDDYFSIFDFHNINQKFKLLSVAKYLDNKHKEKEPLQYPNPRFQLCSAKVNVHKHSACSETFFQKYVVYGYIMVSDRSVSREDGWVPLNQPMYRFASVLNREFYQPVPVTNTCFLHHLTNPSTHHSVSLPSFLDIVFQLYAFNIDVDYDKRFLNVVDERMSLDLSDPESINSPMSHVFQGPDGCAKLYYILFSDSVDATLEITVRKTDPKCVDVAKPVSVKIVARYGDEIDYRGHEKGDYYVSVFLEGSVILVDGLKLDLKNSVFAVHAKGSLIIEAFIGDSSAEVIMNDNWKFDAKHEGGSTGSITGTDCSLDLKVNWKY